MRLTKIAFPLDVILSIVILASGLFAEALIGDEHFSRSGALLVMLALIVALNKERNSKDEKLDSLKNIQKLSKAQHEHYRACGRMDTFNLVIPLYERENERIRKRLFSPKNKPMTENQKDAFSKAQSFSLEGQKLFSKHQSDKNIDKNLETNSESSIAYDWDSDLNTNKANLEQATVEHFRETCIACLGTFVWAYGDIIFKCFFIFT